MAFVDREIQCLDCSQGFVFTAGEQEFYERKGFKEEPKRCKPCRDQRKARRNDTPVAAGGHRTNGNGARPANGRPMSSPASPPASPSDGGFGFRGMTDDDDAQPFTRSAAPSDGDDEDNIGNRADGSAPRRSGNGAPRAANGGGGGGGQRREMFDATCAQCGTSTRVPFKPVPGRPVYCRDCYASRGATAARAR